jgi:UDP:flavonoid glycosyltransferase YjiC (YdhE family)
MAQRGDVILFCVARILYIWELGGGLGHLATALPLANAYRARHHEVAFVVKDIAAAGAVIPAGSFQVYQTPVWHRVSNSGATRPISYAEILLGLGFGDSRKLAAMVRAWIGMFELLTPDLVMLDYSPTAMLAASVAGVRHCTIGPGFFLPPRATPVPGFVRTTNQERLCRSEELLLKSINVVRTQCGAPPLANFAEFFDADLDFLTTWPELDHYPQRKNARYWGPVLLRLGGKSPDWREGSASRVFVYLYGNFPKLETILQAIEMSGVDALIYCPGASETLLQRFRSARLNFSKELYAVDQVLAEAGVLICHGNFGTVWEGMLAGKPLLCLPVHMEHFIATQTLVRLGVAIQPPSEASAEWISGAILRLLTEHEYRSVAGGIALKYRRHNPRIHLEQLVDASTDSLQ